MLIPSCITHNVQYAEFITAESGSLFILSQGCSRCTEFGFLFSVYWYLQQLKIKINHVTPQYLNTRLPHANPACLGITLDLLYNESFCILMSKGILGNLGARQSYILSIGNARKCPCRGNKIKWVSPYFKLSSRGNDFLGSKSKAIVQHWM